jgi:hypothetical protein
MKHSWCAFCIPTNLTTLFTYEETGTERVVSPELNSFQIDLLQHFSMPFLFFWWYWDLNSTLLGLLLRTA